MTDDRSLERAARSWLEEGPNQAPNRPVEAALTRIQVIPQERDLRVPWRTNTMLSRFGVAAAIAVVLLGGALTIGRLVLVDRPGGVPTASPSAPEPTSTEPIASSQPVDYATLGGRILVEHLGNAIDGSESATTDLHSERRRLYFLEPSTMTGETAIEWLPGQPRTGKLEADVSPDGSRVVFMDTADPAQIWMANIDGTGLQLLSEPCDCSQLDPAFDPSGTKIAYVEIHGGSRLPENGANHRVEWGDERPVSSSISIRDLGTGETVTLAGTVSSELDGIPDQPTWSPDGTKIAFSRINWGDGSFPIGGVLQVIDVATSDQAPPTAIVTDGIPGDADWSPDGSRIVFTDRPLSSMGSISSSLMATVHLVDPDGSKPMEVISGGGASYMPDGRILFFSNYLWVMNGDGTSPRPVNLDGADLTDDNVGFVYIGHWVGNP